MADMTRKGFGQVEPNHLSAQYTGQIYAQLPAATVSGTTKTPIEQLENGQFLRYDYGKGVATNGAGDGEWMLVFNEVKLYDERHQNYKDFCMKASDMTDGMIYPRLLKTNIGDIFTTNTFRSSSNATNTTLDGVITMPELEQEDYIKINNDGWLEQVAEKPASGIVFKVVKVYNLADKQDAVKLQRIQ